MRTIGNVSALFGLTLAAGLALCSVPANAQDATGHGQMARAAGQYFTYAGNRIFYQVAGQGEPIILIHGYPLSGELFRHQRSGLSDRFKVITLDLPGYGRSTAPTSAGSIAMYAKDVIALMNHLNIKKAIIGGHSMGGVITIELYREVPQRFAGMILIDTNPMPASIIETAEWNAYAKQASTKGIASTVPLLLPQMLTGNTRLGYPGVADELKGVVMQASVNGFIAGGHSLANRDDYRALIKTVTVPTLILVGLADSLWPFEIDQMMHDAMPTSKLVNINGAAHASIFEKPTQASSAIGTFASGIAGGS